MVLAAALEAPAPAGESSSATPVALTALQRDFMTWRFGMFIHFNLGTFADLDWAGGYEDPALFSPTKLDCGQWADAAKEAGMTYLVLTVKHTEGIVLYPSALTAHDITLFRNFRGGKGDLVREFVGACRSRGLKVGLYYCFPGNYSDDAHRNAPPAGMPDLHGLPPEAAGDYTGFMKRQLAEMLGRYGPVDLLWIDQFDNAYTGKQWPEMLAHLRSLQPRCVIVANNAHNLRDSDVLSYEYPWKAQLPPEGNALPAEVCDTIQTGARWFWREAKQPTDLQTAEAVVARVRACKAGARTTCSTCPPDRDGLISGPQLAALARDRRPAEVDPARADRGRRDRRCRRVRGKRSPWGDPRSNASAILATLPTGADTAQVSGASGETGLALVELYEVHRSGPQGTRASIL